MKNDFVSIKKRPMDFGLIFFFVSGFYRFDFCWEECRMRFTE